MSENQKCLKHSYCLNGVLSLKHIIAVICDNFMLERFIKFSGSERSGCILNG